MKRIEILDTIETILDKAGFQASKRCISRVSCFDLAIRRGKEVAFIKALHNTVNVSDQEASELKKISQYFSVTPLFFSNNIRNRPLEDDTVYMRYDIYTITPKTFGNIVFLEMHPFIEAGPGGYYVSLNGKVIKEKRQKIGLSLGKLAELIGVSRRTIYGYEREITKAGISVAYKLEWILGVPLAKPINIFHQSPQSNGFLVTAKRLFIQNQLLRMVLRQLIRFKFNVIATKKAPFDFIANLPKGQLSLIGGVMDKGENNAYQRIGEIMSISDIVNAQAIFISDSKHIHKNIPIINHKEFKSFNSQEDLVQRL